MYDFTDIYIRRIGTSEVCFAASDVPFLNYIKLKIKNENITFR